MILSLKKKISGIILKFRFPLSKFYSSVNVDLASRFGANSVIFSDVTIFNSQIGDYTYVQKHSTVYNTKIGKFSSIGGGSFIGLPKHPLNYISTSPVFYDCSQPLPEFFTSEINKLVEITTIGNDVWIGQNVMIMSGINIGNGAVIGAGSIVTKDIPDYAIAVGSPCKVVKYRFSEDLILKFLKSKWWDRDRNKIKECHRFYDNPLTFLNKLDD